MLRKVVPARSCPWCRTRRARRIWSETGYWYVRCSSCGGVFADLTAEDYDALRHNAWDEESPSEAALAFYGDARARPHAEFLDRNPPTGERRLLDVGCGLGFFLARAQERGWEVRGVDTSPTWVKLADERLGGGRVELATIEQAELEPGSFQLITAWDVIEHIFEPVPFLGRLRELLADDGRLFIRTPNIAYGYPVYAARRWLLRHEVELGPTNHVVYFTAATMRDALHRARLEPRDWSVHVPPQVGDAASGALISRLGSERVVSLKNYYARVASTVSRMTEGRLLLASDLDVECVAAG